MGPDRLRRLEYEIGRAEIVWPGPHLTDVYASLRAWCVKTGHGLGHKEHEADRWVATTAVWLQVPLVAHDRIFANVKDLELLTKLGEWATCPCHDPAGFGTGLAVAGSVGRAP